MNTPFPFGFPAPTAFYLTLYVLTWVVHLFFMNYVLAGSAYVGASLVVRGRSDETNPLALILRDWLPFMLSAAITAGIAPLLFVQILYEKSFYTANQLLFHRWMAILPTLMLGFYLLYLLKAKFIASKPVAWRVSIGMGAFACFAFIAWSWTENHLLSLQDQSVWVEQYVSGSLRYRNPHLLARLTIWFAGAFPTMATILAWQLYSKATAEQANKMAGTRRASALAISGTAISAAAGAIYLSTLKQPIADVVLSRLGFGYLILACGGMVIQVACWSMIYACSVFNKKLLWGASIGLVCTLLGTAIVRETIRLSTIELTNHFPAHRMAYRVGGFPVFLVSALVCGGLIYYSIRLVRSDLASAEDID